MVKDSRTKMGAKLDLGVIVHKMSGECTWDEQLIEQNV